jgi:hypothetical protein
MAVPGRKYHLSDQFRAEAATAPVTVLEAVMELLEELLPYPYPDDSDLAVTESQDEPCLYIAPVGNLDAMLEFRMEDEGQTIWVTHLYCFE